MIENPQTTYRPVFVLWIALLQQVLLQLFFSFWAGGFFGGLFQTLLRPMLGTLPVTVSPFVAIGATVFVAFPVVVGIGRAMNYRNTVYTLYDDRLEIEEGFLTIHAKRVMFRDVREVSLRRGVLQRSVGLGSVYLATQATGTGAAWNSFGLLGMGSTFGSGAMIKDIAEAGEAYERLRNLVDGTRPD